MNIGQITGDECRRCWNLINCKVCAGEIDFEGKSTLCRETKLKKCLEQKANAMNDLYELCVLKEFGYELLGEGGVVG